MTTTNDGNPAEFSAPGGQNGNGRSGSGGSKIGKAWNTARHVAGVILRRRGWLMDNMRWHSFRGAASNGIDLLLKKEKLMSYPSILKIDISPLCNLACTICVHADPNGRETLEEQYFHAKQLMTVEQYRRIIDEARGKVSAVSLYYLGDPYVHPDVDEMCRIAADAGMNVHLSTNFSFRFTDKRIRQIVESGVTHLTVCVDGMSQEKYQQTRVGGKIEWVLNNLRRVAAVRKELGRKYPKIEIQYIKFQHNVDELEQVRQVAEELDIDTFTDFWGGLHNTTDLEAHKITVLGPKEKKGIPSCFFPYSTMVIKYNGDVIPCCCYRLGEQYTRDDASPKMGNVFETSIGEVWNSEAYQRTRRMVNDPSLADRDESYKQDFCYGCSVIYNTNDAELRRDGNEHKFDSLYTLNVKGRPVRLGEEAAAPAASSAG